MNIETTGIEQLPEQEQKIINDMIFLILNAADLNDYTININLVDDETMLDLCQRFKNKDEVTDVLSFALPEEEKNFEHTKHLLGDVVVCIEQARRQAEEFGHKLEEEVAVLCAHGLFHLLGYDHERSAEDAQLQMQGEMHLLEKAGLSPKLSLIARI